MSGSLPLDGLRVIDLTDGVPGYTGRFLADLGADVVLVEPPDGVASRRQQPRFDGHGLRFAITHLNKRSIVLDLTTADGRDALLRLTDGADVVLESRQPGALEQLGLGQRLMRERNPALVVASITNFGQTGPYRDYQASEPVLVAMSSVTTRSGAPGREPLKPPGELAGQTAAVHAAFAVLLAVFRARRTGSGDYADCSLFDLAVQDLDPGFGMSGTAALGQPLTQLPPERPDRRMLYPIIACADGHVRMFIASARQWHALFGWMGQPEAFADPAYEQMYARFVNWSAIRPHLVELFAGLTRAEIVQRGSELGIPIAAVNTPTEILDSDHVRDRTSFVHVDVAPGVTGRVANGYLDIDGVRAGFRYRAPELGEHTAEVLAEPARDAVPAGAEELTRPLDGLRVLDLGVIVVGAETGRALADQGADVIKVENSAFADGTRQGDGPDSCSYTFAIGHRGKRSIGLNLRDERGRELFEQLVANSDVVLSNFKPGTLESLGLGYERLREINPGIILTESSALGSTGPWRKQMGYGPLVRSTVGLTQLWRHPGAEDAFGDDMTVYPDHAAGRVGIAAVLAALVGRVRTGRGCKVGMAQMEVVFSQLGVEILRESLEPGTLTALGNVGEFDAPSDLFACAGVDAYCAVAVDGDESFVALAGVIGRSDLAADPRFATAEGRVAHRAELDAALQGWISPLEPRIAQDRLQGAGVAAAAAAHVADLLENPQLRARRQFCHLHQPGFPDPLETEMGPALFEDIAVPDPGPAPLLGADTRSVLRDVLGLTDLQVDELTANGVVQTR